MSFAHLATKKRAAAQAVKRLWSGCDASQARALPRLLIRLQSLDSSQTRASALRFLHAAALALQEASRMFDASRFVGALLTALLAGLLWWLF
jgi:hypothetical protein